MLPKFTAEAALPTSGRPYQDRARSGSATGAVAQWSDRRARVVAGDDFAGELGGDLEPATTCTCSCCQVVAGRLVCC